MHLVAERGVPQEHRFGVVAPTFRSKSSMRRRTTLMDRSSRSAADLKLPHRTPSRNTRAASHIVEFRQTFPRIHVDLHCAMRAAAGEKYIEIFGAPKTIGELLKHRLVMQVADQATASESFEGLFPGHPMQDLGVMKPTSAAPITGPSPTAPVLASSQLTPVRLAGRWYLWRLNYIGTSTFGFRITLEAAGFRGCAK